jgi:hypothetical protein
MAGAVVVVMAGLVYFSSGRSQAMHHERAQHAAVRFQSH